MIKSAGFNLHLKFLFSIKLNCRITRIQFLLLVLNVGLMFSP
jgi:hypothetical protein